MQLEYVDVVFANRPDSNTPMEGRWSVNAQWGTSLTGAATFVESRSRRVALPLTFYVVWQACLLAVLFWPDILHFLPSLRVHWLLLGLPAAPRSKLEPCSAEERLSPPHLRETGIFLGLSLETQPPLCSLLLPPVPTQPPYATFISLHLFPHSSIKLSLSHALGSLVHLQVVLAKARRSCWKYFPIFLLHLLWASRPWEASLLCFFFFFEFLGLEDPLWSSSNFLLTHLCRESHLAVDGNPNQSDSFKCDNVFLLLIEWQDWVLNWTAVKRGCCTSHQTGSLFLATLYRSNTSGKDCRKQIPELFPASQSVQFSWRLKKNVLHVSGQS